VLSMRSPCPICGDFRRDPATSGLFRAYGGEALSAAHLYRHGEYVLFCPVAPLVPGYLMIAPVRHAENSLLHRPAGALSRLVTATLRALELRFGTAWCFEHAGRAADGTSCVPHGHIHLLPGAPPPALFASARRILPAEPDSDGELSDVYVRTAAGAVGLVLENRDRQHVRRVIAAASGQRLGWDWRIHRHPETYRATNLMLPALVSDLGYPTAMAELAPC
jgi:diadenosine tetraphosphate (Ap4A) HIT family hydrolase